MVVFTIIWRDRIIELMIRVRVKHIDIHNFLSFQDEEWDFDNTNRLVLIKGVNRDTFHDEKETSNGSGKSSLSHALMYALFGQLNGKIHNSNLKNKYVDTSTKDGWKMRVAVEVDTHPQNSEVKHWKIVRGLQKSLNTASLQLLTLVDGEWQDVSKSTSSNTQRFIEDNVVMMNFEMYQRLVMLSVEDKYNFFKMTPSSRRDFVETLLDTSVYSKMYKMMCDDIKTKNMVIQGLKVEQVKLGKNKELCEDEIEKYKAGVSVQIDSTKSEIASKEASLSDFAPKFEDLSERMKVVEDALAKIRENKAKLETLLAKCNERLTNFRIDINNCNTTISHHEREINKHKEVLGMICEDCQRTVNKFYSLDVYRAEISGLKEKIKKSQGEIDECVGKMEKVKECDNKLKAEEMEQMSSLSDMQVQVRNLQYQKTQVMDSISALERRVSTLLDSMEDEHKIPSWSMYQKILSDIDEVERNLKDEFLNLCTLKVGSEMVSPDSIQRNIVSRVVSSINAMINTNLSHLCVNFVCNLTDDMNDYEIQSSGGELDFPNLSMGEQMKLMLSTQLAFRKFFISRFNVCMNIMIIDEIVDVALDSVSIQKLLEMLLQLSQKEDTNISIISHRSEVEQMFKDMPETQMMVVQKQDNISRIVRD